MRLGRWIFLSTSHPLEYAIGLYCCPWWLNGFGQPQAVFKVNLGSWTGEVVFEKSIHAEEDVS